MHYKPDIIYVIIMNWKAIIILLSCNSFSWGDQYPNNKGQSQRKKIVYETSSTGLHWSLRWMWQIIKEGTRQIKRFLIPLVNIMNNKVGPLKRRNSIHQAKPDVVIKSCTKHKLSPTFFFRMLNCRLFVCFACVRY